MYKELNDAWAELTAADSMFAVQEIEVRGQKLKSFAAAPPSLRDVWQLTAGFAERDYMIYEDEKWTYAQAMSETAAIANWMAANGIQQGDRVALALRNYPEWMLCYWALASVGITVVGMNAWWVSDEMHYALSDSTPKALICDEERLERFLPIRGDFPHMKVIGVRLKKPMDGVTSYAELKARGGDMPQTAIDGDEDACIFYTSGTTGRPKGAQLTQRGCVLNIMNIAFMNLCQATALARANGDAPPALDQMPPNIILVTTPLFHVTANNCAVQPATLTGGTAVHMYKWDAETALKLIEKHKITAMTGVPVMAREVISHPDFKKYDTSSMVSLGGGGAPLQPDLVGKIGEALQNGKAGTGYGMTEVCGIITSISNDYFVDKPESAGRIVPTLDAKCVDENGQEVAQGELGELWVKGGNVIKGYLNREEATAESITDGWLHTGDIARFDEQGFLYIVDRAKDMVLRGGENIYCAEVENALFKHAAVAECAVFGVEDDRLGEEVGAAVVLAQGTEVSASELRDHCAPLLAKFKIPRYIWLRRDLLPRNASGKFLKRELRDTLAIDDAA